jgi:hypothetical protein
MTEPALARGTCAARHRPLVDCGPAPTVNALKKAGPAGPACRWCGRHGVARPAGLSRTSRYLEGERVAVARAGTSNRDRDEARRRDGQDGHATAVEPGPIVEGASACATPSSSPVCRASRPCGRPSFRRAETRLRAGRDGARREGLGCSEQGEDAAVRDGFRGKPAAGLSDAPSDGPVLAVARPAGPGRPVVEVLAQSSQGRWSYRSDARTCRDVPAPKHRGTPWRGAGSSRPHTT